MVKVPVGGKAWVIKNRFFIVRTFPSGGFFLLIPAFNTPHGWMSRWALVRRSGVHAPLTLIGGALIRLQFRSVSNFQEKNLACGKP